MRPESGPPVGPLAAASRLSLGRGFFSALIAPQVPQAAHASMHRGSQLGQMNLNPVKPSCQGPRARSPTAVTSITTCHLGRPRCASAWRVTCTRRLRMTGLTDLVAPEVVSYRAGNDREDDQHGHRESARIRRLALVCRQPRDNCRMLGFVTWRPSLSLAAQSARALRTPAR